MIWKAGSQEGGGGKRFLALPLGRPLDYNPPMPSTGDRLRLERERRQITIPQAADATNIKADHIRAIEADDWDAFSAPVYVRGFVKTYARFLRLNDREVAAQLDEELAGRGERDAEGRPVSLRRGPLDFIMLQLALVRWQILFPVLLGAALLGAAWWGWNSWQQQPAPAAVPTVSPRLYQPRSDGLPGTLPLPPATNAPATERRGR